MKQCPKRFGILFLLMTLAVSLAITVGAQGASCIEVEYAGAQVWDIVLAPSGERFVLNDGQRGMLYYENRKPTVICSDPNAKSVFDPEGQYIVFISNKILKVWSISEKMVVRTANIGEHLDMVFGMTWIRDEILIRCSKNKEQYIVVIDFAGLNVRKVIPSDDIQDIASAAQRPGEVFVLRTDHSHYPFCELGTIDLDTCKVTGFGLPFEKFLIMYRFAVSPNGKLAVAQNAKTDDLLVQIIELSNHKVLHEFELEGLADQVYAISWNSDGDMIGIGFDFRAFLILLPR